MHYRLLERLADPLGLTLQAEASGLRVRRATADVALEAPVVDTIEAALAEAPVMGRHLAFGVLLGVRLGLDRRLDDYTPADERPARPEKVFHHHEIPSVYGERLPRLVPELTVRWCESVSGDRLLTDAWLVDSLQVVYVLERNKALHCLALAEVDRLDFDAEKVRRDARHALFYEAYKLRPKSTERTDVGQLRIFGTSEGLGASRALLMPDFDYDAAQDGGTFAIPDRDTLIVGRPDGRANAEAMRQRVREAARLRLAEAPYPLTPRLFGLRTSGVDVVDEPVVAWGAIPSAALAPEG